MEIIGQPLQFDWDNANRAKNFIKHGVTGEECEEVFFTRKKLIFHDTRHSLKEKRYWLYAETRAGRQLLIVFTKRKNKIRVISARDLNKKERKLYEEAVKNSSF